MKFLLVNSSLQRRGVVCICVSTCGFGVGWDGDEHLQTTFSPCGKWWKRNAPTVLGKKNLLVASVLEEED